MDNTLNTPTALLYNFGQPIWGARNLGGAWVPALSAPADALGALPAGDVIVVRRPSGVGWALIDQMASPAADLAISPTTGFAQGDLLMVADCSGASVLQATNAGPGAAGVISHNAGAGGGVPGLASSSLARSYAHDARVWRMQTLIYHLADSARRPGETALWVSVHPVYDGGSARRELVTGVERLATGLSLVELMIGLALGLFVVAVMGTMYLGSRSTFQAQESGTRLQENGRYAVEALTNDIRMSGFRGCQGDEAVDNTLNTPTDRKSVV